MHRRSSYVAVTTIILMTLSITMFTSINADVPDGAIQLSGDVYDGDGGPLTAGNYHIIDDVVVPSGQMLTIQPGAQIYFEPGFKITSKGTLLANGASVNSISLMSARDDYWIKLYHGSLTLQNDGYVRLVPMVSRYVTSEYVDGDGKTIDNPAYYLDMAFWYSIRSSLTGSPVTVWFLDGEYNKKGSELYGLPLFNMGHDNHLLTLQGVTDDGAILNAEVEIMLLFDNCKNMKIKDLNFNGDIKRDCIMISSSHHIDIDSCTFIDLENLRLGAVKPVSSGTNNITIRNCKFTRVGSGGGCHMIYAAYGPDHIYVIDNIFEDCPGSYVKFRDRADYGYVKGNTFIFTGDFQSYLYDDYKYTPPFILMTVEDDNCNPDGAEYFGTNYEITGNIFQFEDDFSYNHTVIGFFQRVYEECIGYRLVGYNEGMENLTNGTPEQQKWFLKEGKIPWIEIDLDKIICSDNYYNGVDFRAFFESRPVFSHTPGEYWDSLADISIALEAN